MKKMNLTLNLVVVIAAISIQSAHASAVQECKNRADIVASEIADIRLVHFNKFHNIRAYADQRLYYEPKSVVDRFEKNHSNEDKVRINDVLNRSGYGEIDFGDLYNSVKTISDKWVKDVEEWLIFRDGKKVVSSNHFEAYAAGFNRYKDKQESEVRQSYGRVKSLIEDRYCTNDPSDCYGTINIDPASGIVFNENSGRSVDLSLCVSKGLPGANLAKKDLRGVNLAGANLQGADFRRSNLAGANMAGTDMQGASLGKANMAGAVLPKANMTGANLAEAVFEKANLAAANLKGAFVANVDFSNSNLAGAIMDGADLTGAVFTNAAMGAASLKGAVLKGARFIGTRVTIAQLSVANWAGVIVEEVQAKALNELDSAMEAFTEAEKWPGSD